MKLQTSVLPEAAAPRYLAARCEQCGSPLSLPEWSEQINERCVRHLWACDDCGYRFETSVYFAR